MNWHDWIFAVGSWIFIFALIPSIKSNEKPAFYTSLLTGTVIIIFALNYLSLNLWLSGVSSASLGIGWGILAWQKYRQKK